MISKVMADVLRTPCCWRLQHIAKVTNEEYVNGDGFYSGKQNSQLSDRLQTRYSSWKTNWQYICMLDEGVKQFGNK